MLRTKGNAIGGVVALCMFAIPCLSSADTVNFNSGTTGNTGSATFTDGATGLTVHGYYLDGGSWADANLYRRDTVGDRGFGICNPLEASANGGDCPSGNGDINELDNLGQTEIMALELPAGYRWVSVAVSSLDTNDGDSAGPERGLLYANPDDSFGTTPGAIGATVIQNLTGTGTGTGAEQTINIPQANETSPFLVFEPYDHTTNSPDATNDYLVWSATIEPLEIDGRMTGGGSVFTEDGMRVTHGFEIHCNLAEPNNIEVNWAGNRFHLLSLDHAVCTEDPAIHQKPPTAPFDTFEGDGTGRLNGVDGASINFVFVDGGEPGKVHDTASIVIRDSQGDVVLTVSGLLDKGNQQAHPNNK
jgi:hypothetical protein